MLSRRLYVASFRAAAITILLGAAAGLYAVFFPPQNAAFLTKFFLTLASILAGSTITMAVASLSKVDPDARRHRSFRFTKPLGDECPGASEAGSRNFRRLRPTAPEPILRAALRVLHVASFTTRNWTLSEEISRKQINDLWEAIHEIPDLLKRWDRPAECEGELLTRLREYDAKWPAPKLEEIFHNALKNPDSY